MSPPLRPQPPATPLATSDRAAASAIAAHRPQLRRVLTARSCVAHAPGPLAASSLPRCSCAACSRQLPRHSLRRLRSRSCAARRRAAHSRAACSPPAAAQLTLPRRLPPREVGRVLIGLARRRSVSSRELWAKNYKERFFIFTLIVGVNRPVELPQTFVAVR